MTNLIGKSLGRYHILEQLGAPQGCFAKCGMAFADLPKVSHPRHD